MGYLDPPEEDQVIDLERALRAARVAAPVGYWDEDGKLYAGDRYDENGRLPYVGTLDWNDALSEKQNELAAARKIRQLTELDRNQRRRWNRLRSKLRAYKPAPVTVPTFADWRASMDFPEGDFDWDPDEAGDWSVFCCGEKDCPRQWHKTASAMQIERKEGKIEITVRSCDEDGNWNIDSGYEEGEGGWEEFFIYALSARSMDAFFRGWADYHLQHARTGGDPAEAFFKSTDATSAKHLDAAAYMIKYLYPRKGRK